MLILGCGTDGRGDDAAGLLAVRRMLAGLSDPSIKAREYTGDMLSLVDAWSGWDSVILIDAVLSGASPGTIHVWSVRTLPRSGVRFRHSTHQFGLGEGIDMARTLGRIPSQLTIYGIEAGNCEPGARVSPEVGEAVEHLARLILTAS